MRGSRRTYAAVTALMTCLIVVISACSSATTESRQASSCITTFDANTDYFPTKVMPEQADNFSVSYHKSYAVLTVKQPSPGASPRSYVLVQCGAPKPALADSLRSAPQITVPVTSFFAGSTTQVPPIVDIGGLDQLTGVADGSLISNTAVAKRVSDGQVAVYARGGTIDVESVLAANPGVVMTDGVDAPEYNKLAQAGIGVVAGADWLESTPLGRAEWIKVIALLTGHEAKANEIYAGVRDRYRDIAARARDAQPVEVLTGTMYQGTWSAPAGGSYFGALLADARASWPWQDRSGTGPVSLGFESVYTAGGQLRLWLVIDNTWQRTADIVAADSRYGTLAAVREGQVWNANKAMGATGGNDYLERGATRPDLVLGDLVAIVHPTIEPNHEFTFYQRLPQS